MERLGDWEGIDSMCERVPEERESEREREKEKEEEEVQGGEKGKKEVRERAIEGVRERRVLCRQ